jgi:hypothetical protein
MVFLGVDLFVLLEVLRALEGFFAYLGPSQSWLSNRDSTNLADMGLEGGVHPEMAGDMVPLCAGGATVLPLAGETEVVGALAAYVLVAEMVVEGLWVGE